MLVFVGTLLHVGRVGMQLSTASCTLLSVVMVPASGSVSPGQLKLCCIPPLCHPHCEEWHLLHCLLRMRSAAAIAAVRLPPAHSPHSPALPFTCCSWTASTCLPSCPSSPSSTACPAPWCWKVRWEGTRATVGEGQGAGCVKVLAVAHITHVHPCCESCRAHASVCRLCPAAGFKGGVNQWAPMWDAGEAGKPHSCRLLGDACAWPLQGAALPHRPHTYGFPFEWLRLSLLTYLQRWRPRAAWLPGSSCWSLAASSTTCTTRYVCLQVRLQRSLLLPAYWRCWRHLLPPLQTVCGLFALPGFLLLIVLPCSPSPSCPLARPPTWCWTRASPPSPSQVGNLV